MVLAWPGTPPQAISRAGPATGLAVVAVDSARFAFTEVRLGIIPAVISPFVLGKIGESAARRYFLTAELLTAATLKEMGLAHEVVAADQLDAACTRLSEALLQGAPGALAGRPALFFSSHPSAATFPWLIIVP